MEPRLRRRGNARERCTAPYRTRGFNGAPASSPGKRAASGGVGLAVLKLQWSPGFVAGETIWTVT